MASTTCSLITEALVPTVCKFGANCACITTVAISSIDALSCTLRWLGGTATVDSSPSDASLLRPLHLHARRK